MSLQGANAAERLAMLRQAIQDRKNAASRPRSKPTTNVPCRFFSRGLCQRSGSCPFSHLQRSPAVAKFNKPTSLKRSRSASSPESRLQILNDLLNTHQQQKNKKMTLTSGAASDSTSRRLTSTKSMSWIRAGFTPQRHASKPDPVSKPKSLLINGIRFRLSHCGRSLVRCPDRADSTSASVQQARIIPSRVQLGGTDFIKTSAGTLVRSSVQSSRRTASQRLKRSLQLVRSKKLDKRKQQLCMFFCRFGFCKLDKVCPFVHDTSKVAICRTFVANGVCSTPETCLLSHTLDRNKMPECSHYLKGICAKGDFCPYRHVKVSEEASFCQDFIRGYCSKGEQCKLRHAYSTRRGKPSSSGQVSDRHNV